MAVEQEKWLDISDEVEREYIYAAEATGSAVGSTTSLFIARPKKLKVSPSSLGGHAHRIETEDGHAYYITPGWKAIRWSVKEGKQLFAF